jgi:hypothetical protein
MTVTQTATEALIQTKIDNLSGSSSLKEILLLCKSIQALRNNNPSLGVISVGV